MTLKTGRKLSGGGPWDGDIWAPGGASKQVKAGAKQFGNGLVETEQVIGRVHQVVVFRGEERFAVELFQDVNGFAVPVEGAARLLMPNHGSLERSLSRAVGAVVIIDATGEDEIKTGPYAGSMVKTYDVTEVDASVVRE